eukprot:COSAG04_NODE_1620_length_6138_cov_2.991886_6_plen_79_part_00
MSNKNQIELDEMKFLMLGQLDFEWSPMGKYLMVDGNHKIRENEKLETITSEGEQPYPYDELVSYINTSVNKWIQVDSR